MKFIDWFAGIGGFRRGMELAGHECVGFCEFDRFAVASYTSMHLLTDSQRDYLLSLPLKQRQKEILNEEYRNGEWYAADIRSVRAADIPKSDCWCFGAPCQDFSIAGRRAGLDGDRSSLVRQIFRLLGETRGEDRPEWLFYENVKGMLSSNKGYDYLAILSEMDELGYDAEWQLIDSQYFGVPQHRERVFTVGHSRRFGRRQILPVGKNGESFPVEEGYKNLCANTLKSSNHVVGTYIATDRQTDRQTDIIDSEGERFPHIVQVGNWMPERKRKNPNPGRVYSTKGISPCLTNLSGGGGRVPWIIY